MEYWTEKLCRVQTKDVGLCREENKHIDERRFPCMTRCGVPVYKYKYKQSRSSVATLYEKTYWIPNLQSRLAKLGLDSK